MAYNNNATWSEPTLPDHIDNVDPDTVTDWVDNSVNNMTIAFVKLDPPESNSKGGVVVEVKQLSSTEDTVEKVKTTFNVKGTLGDDIAAIKCKQGLPIGYIWTGTNFRHPNI